MVSHIEYLFFLVDPTYSTTTSSICMYKILCCISNFSHSTVLIWHECCCMCIHFVLRGYMHSPLTILGHNFNYFALAGLSVFLTQFCQ